MLPDKHGVSDKPTHFIIIPKRSNGMLVKSKANDKKMKFGRVDNKANLELILLALPGVALVFIFSYLPLPGIVIAFKNFMYNKGIFGSPWVGFDNFKFLFLSDTIKNITVNTIFLNLMFIVTGTLTSIAIALMLFEITKKAVVKTFQTIMIFPHFLSWVVVGYMFYGLINPQYGLVNLAIKSLGGNAIDWYGTPDIWPALLVITNLWKGAGMGSVIYYATLMGIDKEYYEAASIDGATKWQMTRRISIPFLLPLVVIMTILAIGNIIRSDFGMFYYLTRDVPTLYSTTDVVDTYVYRALRSIGDPGMAAAAGLYQSVAGFVLILATNLTVKKIQPENALF